MKSRFFAVCFSLAGLLLASSASAQSFGDFFLGGGWSGHSTIHAASGMPPEKVGDFKPLAEHVAKKLPQGADLRESASGFRNLGDFVSAVYASSDLKIPFQDVKARMMNGGNLYTAIAALRPEIDSGVAMRNARASAHEAIKQI